MDSWDEFETFQHIVELARDHIEYDIRCGLLVDGSTHGIISDEDYVIDEDTVERIVDAVLAQMCHSGLHGDIHEMVLASNDVGDLVGKPNAAPPDHLHDFLKGFSNVFQPQTQPPEQKAPPKGRVGTYIPPRILTHAEKEANAEQAKLAARKKEYLDRKAAFAKTPQERKADFDATIAANQKLHDQTSDKYKKDAAAKLLSQKMAAEKLRAMDKRR
jgi:hypothetical protein